MVETWRIHAPMRIDISVYMYSFIYTLICMYVHLQVIFVFICSFPPFSYIRGVQPAKVMTLQV